MAGPYRATYREVDVDKITGASEPLEEFSVSAPDGAHGVHGHSGRSGRSTGASGSRGGDAGPAQRGADAGSIHVTLRTGGADGILSLSGTQTTALGKQQAIKSIVTVGAAGTVDLLADGGRGGDGGDGGEGGPGARGSDGSDATRYSSGSNGGSGGDGGDGGDATHGADGGHAGDIQIEVADEDSQLLMLVRHTIRGGDGGDAGVNGAGGPGGSGGDGGSSYSWTETSTSTDSDGNTQTSTSYHSNPGGSDGSPGAQGRSGQARVQRGQNGNRGSFAIHLSTPEGIERYDACYDLALASYSHESMNKDSVYEPGEGIRVFDIAVRNVGGMPTPRHRDITTRLMSEGWVNPEHGQELILPRGIAAGETTELPGELHFAIGDYLPQGPGDPLEREEALRLRATLPAISRDFTRYEGEESAPCGLFVIRFPVRISEIEALHSLAPGQVGRMRYQVVNQSTGDLGRASACGRVLRVRLAMHESELGAEQMIFLDTSGAKVSLQDGFVHEIPLLKAGEATTLEVALGVPQDVEHYRSATLRWALELGYLDEPLKARPIQYREFITRVSRPYQHIEDADLLLVVNHGTTRAELDAWYVLAANLGLRLNTWDMSLMGHLDLERSIGTSSLIDDFVGKTIVILDCEIDTPLGLLRPHVLLGKEQFFRSVANGINLALLGPDCSMAEMLVRTKSRLKEWAGSPKLLLESLEDARDIHDDELQGLDCSVTLHGRRWWWQEPQEAELESRALELQTQLRNEHPDRRYIVIYEFSPQKQSKALVSRKWQLGTCSVVATLNSAAGTVVHAEVAARKLHDPEYILGDSNILALLLTKSLDEKLVRLDQLLYRDGIPALLGNVETGASDYVAASPTAAHMLSLLVDAICADLANEMSAVLSTRWRSGLSSAQMERSMPLLDTLSCFRFSGPPHPPGSPGGNHLIRLMALTLFCAKSQASWWEWLPPFVFMRRSVALRRHAKRLIEIWVETVFDENAKLARRHIKKAIKQEARKRRAAKKSLGDRRKRSLYAQELLLAPIGRREITTDAEVLADASTRVLSRARFDEIAEAELVHDQRREAVVSANLSSREQLLRPEDASLLEVENVAG